MPAAGTYDDAMQVIEMRLRLIAARKGTPEAIQHTQHHSGQKFQLGAVRGNGGYGRALVLRNLAEALPLRQPRIIIRPMHFRGAVARATASGAKRPFTVTSVV